MGFLSLLLASLVWGTASAVPAPEHDETYDYIVVGSGPGGTPVATELARNGYSVLLMDAGDDQRANLNTSVSIVLADVAAEDETLRWDYFVRYHADDEIANSNRYPTWETVEGDHYVGQDPPEGAKFLGIYYPRAGTLGGCSAHNAGAVMVPADNFWDHIANITGDEGWGLTTFSHENMRRYFVQFENNTYLPPGTPGHGFDGWLATSIPRNIDGLAESRPEQFEIYRQLATALGHNPEDLLDRMRTDANSIDPYRDQQHGIFNFPFHNTALGNRINANLLLASTLAQTKSDGSPANPLTLQLESLVIKVLFAPSTPNLKPRAMGVEYLRGKSLYRADPRATRTGPPPATHTAYARHSVILSAGVFNTPQLLKLSGIGPASELASFNIPLILDLPGVGARLQDDYEISLAAHASISLPPPPNPNAPICTHGILPDPCLDLWQNQTGPYTVPRSTHSIHLASSVALHNRSRDLVMWNPPDIFRGFYPGYSRPQGDPDSTFSFAMAHAQGRNHGGGTVTLRSADPRDTPEIFFNFWAEGAEEDLQALYEGVEFARGILRGVEEPIGPFAEVQPCVGGVELGACGEEATKDFIRRQVYSHHASSSAAIGADGDPLAVLDGRFRVQGVDGLRVVDGSALPRVPSPFPIVGQFMASFRAADMILEDAKLEGLGK
ncbi:choline dehydrogenase-like protein [Cercophora newfieldiana]|uniref:Choline dehydrogenase-like protein n=1 Tax=Cercophora newfieldiana TaxID=92897 RepID=A0AA39YID7_9PEZI|nr:choline dehydrogenase-like protein [Cercophora newfieldiana]